MLYFDKVRGAILDDSEDEEGEVSRLREAALASVRDDPGLHQLVPYFVQFIAEKVTHSIARLEVLRGMIRLAAALCANPSLFIEPYVNGLCAPVLTCLLSSKLGSEGRSATGERELEREKEQYQLRDLSASLLGLIAGKYGSSSSQLKPRLARTCLKYFLDPAKPLPVHYGAILGLLAVGGAEAARQLIVPNLRHYEAVLVKGQGDGKGVDVELVLGAVMRGVEGLRDGAGGVGRGQNGLGPDDMKAELEAFVGPLVAGRVLALGDEGLVREVLACRS
jgi:transcription initiation factor TFIID subunit 6